MRVPNSGQAERERLALIEKLERDLERLARIPSHRREAEHADIIEQDCRSMLEDLRAGRPLIRREAPPPDDLLTMLEL